MLRYQRLGEPGVGAPALKCLPVREDFCDSLGEGSSIGDVAGQPVPYVKIQRWHVAGPASRLEHIHAIALGVPAHLSAYLVAGHRGGGLSHLGLIETSYLDL